VFKAENHFRQIAQAKSHNFFLFEPREVYGFFFPPPKCWLLWLFTQPICVWAFGYIIRPLSISAWVSDFHISTAQHHKSIRLANKFRSTKRGNFKWKHKAIRKTYFQQQLFFGGKRNWIFIDILAEVEVRTAVTWATKLPENKAQLFCRKWPGQ